MRFAASDMANRYFFRGMLIIFSEAVQFLSESDGILACKLESSMFHGTPLALLSSPSLGFTFIPRRTHSQDLSQPNYFPLLENSFIQRRWSGQKLRFSTRTYMSRARLSILAIRTGIAVETITSTNLTSFTALIAIYDTKQNRNRIWRVRVGWALL